MPAILSKQENERGLLDPPASPGGDFYANPENDAGDILDNLFGDHPSPEEAEDLADLEEDPHTDPEGGLHPTPTRTTPKAAAPAPAPDADRFARMEAMLAQMQEQNALLQNALLQRDVEQLAPPQEEEEPAPAEPVEPDEEVLRLFQMGDPDATKKFINWVKDVAVYQAAKNLDTSLPKRVEKTLNTLTKDQGQLQTRVEAWWEKNGDKVAAIREGKPFQDALKRLEESGKLSHKYIEAQMDRVLQHVEEQARLYGVEASPTNGAPAAKPKPTGPVARGFRPTTGGASRRAPASAGEGERGAANTVDALLGSRPLTSFHM
jgi:hypothetical protein